MSRLFNARIKRWEKSLNLDLVTVWLDRLPESEFVREIGATNLPPAQLTDRIENGLHSSPYSDDLTSLRQMDRPVFDIDGALWIHISFATSIVNTISSYAAFLPRGSLSIFNASFSAALSFGRCL